MRLLGGVSFGLSILMLAGCEDFDIGGISDRYREDFHFSYPLNAGATVQLENSNGSVEIVGWDKNTIEIDGTKFASSEDRLRDMKIDVQSSQNSVYIRTIPPMPRMGNYGARYVIHVPRRVELQNVISSNGAIRLETIDSRVCGAGSARCPDIERIDRSIRRDRRHFSPYVERRHQSRREEGNVRSDDVKRQHHGAADRTGLASGAAGKLERAYRSDHGRGARGARRYFKLVNHRTDSRQYRGERPGAHVQRRHHLRFRCQRAWGDAIEAQAGREYRAGGAAAGFGNVERIDQDSSDVTGILMTAVSAPPAAEYDCCPWSRATRARRHGSASAPMPAAEMINDPE